MSAKRHQKAVVNLSTLSQLDYYTALRIDANTVVQWGRQNPYNFGHMYFVTNFILL